MAIRTCSPLPVTVFLVLLTLSGCGSAIHGEDGAQLATQASEIRIANSLTTHALVLNAISANPESNEKLATTALAQLFNPWIPVGSPYESTQKRLGDPDAQQFMSYLVSCALAPGQFIQWRNPLPPAPGAIRQWQGKAGLCPQWATSAPTADCLQRVSSCLLARNNAVGRRVELSMRGEHAFSVGGPNIYTLEAKTRPADHDPVTALPLASFEPCGVGLSGPARDCGWAADGIGMCDASGLLMIGAGGQTSCPGPVLGSSTSGQTVLRVCEGVVGCDHGDVRNMGEATGSCSGTSPVPVVTISCTPGQYYSVMTAPWDSTDAPGTVNVEVSPDPVSRYGLSEREVYSVREGAFYGTLFGIRRNGASTVLAQGVNVDVKVEGTGEHARYTVMGDQVEIPGSIYTRMFSCYDPEWASGPAYSSNRLCALPNASPGMSENCAAKVTGACFKSLNPAVPGQCNIQEGPMTSLDRDYEQCRDTSGNTWMHPVTTFLHSACDTVPSMRGRAATSCQQL
ncbi:hypothetical protein ACLESO_35745 [Pyxidicoccus sp. 3LG]